MDRQALIAIGIILGVLVIDQAIKLWVKTSFMVFEDRMLLPGIIRLYFVENEGMAFGMKFGGTLGKYLLGIFRLIVSAGIAYYISLLVRQKAPVGLLICISLVFAGAIGNLIDSAVYGFLFDRGSTWVPEMERWSGYYEGVARLDGSGYAGFLQGHVVDMLQFTVRWPLWVPKLGGQLVFSPIFNVADAAITMSVFAILIFQKRFFGAAR